MVIKINSCFSFKKKSVLVLVLVFSTISISIHRTIMNDNDINIIAIQLSFIE